jgi:plastocyanin
LAPLAIAGTTEAATVTVVVNGGLTPQALTVVVGTTVTWQMTDGDKHRIRSVTAPAEFDSGGIDPGGSYSRTFGSAGTITYRDEEHKDSAAYSGTDHRRHERPDRSARTTTTPPPATPGPTTPAGPAQIRIANRAFTPASISVATGSTVIWTNNDKDTHTVTSRTGAFDSGNLGRVRRSVRPSPRRAPSPTSATSTRAWSPSSRSATLPPVVRCRRLLPHLRRPLRLLLRR